MKIGAVSQAVCGPTDYHDRGGWVRLHENRFIELRKLSCGNIDNHPSGLQPSERPAATAFLITCLWHDRE